MASMSMLSDRDKTAHLLRRFGLGASEAEIAFYLADSAYEDAVERILAPERVDEEFQLGIQTLRPPDAQRIPRQALVNWWHARLLITTRPLIEKMTLFWHDHFATSAQKVNQTLLMYQQNETLREHALGNFRTLLHAMAKDPAMLFWLDNHENVAGRPNENFAREVMELFTIGIGHYSERDVREAARAFTGWAFRRAPFSPDAEKPVAASFVMRPGRHDRGEKNVLGMTGRLSGEEVLDHLCDMPQTSEHIVEKLVHWFVMPSPPAGYVDRLAKLFREEKLEIRPLLRAIMLSPEFLSQSAHRSIVKNPVDFSLSTMRQLGMGQIVQASIQRSGGLARSMPIVRALSLTLRNMGMQLFFPPDVNGWPTGKAWVTSATMVERIGWGDRLFGRGTGHFRIPFSASDLLAEARTASDVVQKMVSIFDADVPASKLNTIEAAVKSARPEPNHRAAMCAKLLFATPQFQMS